MTLLSIDNSYKMSYNSCIMTINLHKKDIKQEDNMNKSGFTLAEVLITLGVIGVVAAMTMPTVINKAQQYVLRQQFKKSVNILSNAVRKTYADLEYTPHCSYNLGDGTNNGTASECIEFHEKLVKNLKTIKYCPDKALENGCIADIKGLDTVARSKDPDLSEEDARKNYAAQSYFREYEIQNSDQAWVLSDGQVLVLYNRHIPLYLVDINGKKGPNKWGYDIYTFFLSKYTIQCIYDVIEKGGTSCTTLMQNNK